MNLALFDFDGTITTREMLPDFFRRAIPRHRLLIGQILLAPLIVGYKMGLVSGVAVRAAIVRVGLTGCCVAQYQRQGAEFAEVVLPNFIRPEVLERINWHRERGDLIVVVSGAFDVYLSHWCRSHGLELICSSLEAKKGRLTGRYNGPQCVRLEKARRVNAQYDLGKFSSVYAYGDTPEDADLLKIAHRKYYQGREVIRNRVGSN